MKDFWVTEINILHVDPRNLFNHFNLIIWTSAFKHSISTTIYQRKATDNAWLISRIIVKSIWDAKRWKIHSPNLPFSVGVPKDVAAASAQVRKGTPSPNSWSWADDSARSPRLGPSISATLTPDPEPEVSVARLPSAKRNHRREMNDHPDKNCRSTIDRYDDNSWEKRADKARRDEFIRLKRSSSRFTIDLQSSFKG